MTKKYKPPKSQAEARERIDRVRRMIDEKTKESGAEIVSRGMVSMPILHDVLECHKFLTEHPD